MGGQRKAENCHFRQNKLLTERDQKVVKRRRSRTDKNLLQVIDQSIKSLIPISWPTTTVYIEVLISSITSTQDKLIEIEV